MIYFDLSPSLLPSLLSTPRESTPFLKEKGQRVKVVESAVSDNFGFILNGLCSFCQGLDETRTRYS